ncbi:NAD(P)/FAD-dependent oxidoreductase [Pontivivens ytuae]|uniref:Thioredoxin reductase n=1 Tax=Pontivivens ytuae TaxID=2789856 RepID=A0A7S9LRI9_9RHOB|nr:NAD(P)/FAD-dependent oxidoreductase [Pontivivens ytuae]QPH53964.1 NAD(P)/FAD-dependent oxidoreductase [Pontivivens ytuae]
MSKTQAAPCGRRLDDVDVAIVGGSFAGLSAAYPLVRSRRKTLLIHDGSPRNRFSPESHNWLALDGATPEAVHGKGIEELSRYQCFSELQDRVVTAQRSKADRHLELSIIELTTASGTTVRAKRLVLATGMRDTFPFGIDGLEDCWGRSVLQCPYCHGYEHRDVPTGILHGGPASVHQARNLPDYATDLIYFTNDAELEDADQSDLESRGYRIEAGKVSHVAHRDGLMEAVVLANGDAIARDALYVLPRAAFASDLHKQLGCGETEGTFGPYVTVDDLQETTERGVFAAGDMTRPAFNAVWAGADGNRAGIFAHQSLVSVHNPYRGAKL